MALVTAVIHGLANTRATNLLASSIQKTNTIGETRHHITKRLASFSIWPLHLIAESVTDCLSYVLDFGVYHSGRQVKVPAKNMHFLARVHLERKRSQFGRVSLVLRLLRSSFSSFVKQ